MDAVVVYASQFGNTRRIAEAIGRGLGPDARVVEAEGFSPALLSPGSLLVVGSPIVRWKPLEGLGIWLDGLVPGSLHGVHTASFDTRVKLFIHGDAAKKIEQALEKAGAERAADPTWYYVAGAEGPLLDGELERAEAWGRELATPRLAATSTAVQNWRPGQALKSSSLQPRFRTLGIREDTDELPEPVGPGAVFQPRCRGRGAPWAGRGKLSLRNVDPRGAERHRRTRTAGQACQPRCKLRAACIRVLERDPQCCIAGPVVRSKHDHARGAQLVLEAWGCSVRRLDPKEPEALAPNE